MDGVDDGVIDRLTAVIASVPGVVSVGQGPCPVERSPHGG